MLLDWTERTLFHAEGYSAGYVLVAALLALVHPRLWVPFCCAEDTVREMESHNTLVDGVK